MAEASLPIGHIGEYDPQMENIASYLERLSLLSIKSLCYRHWSESLWNLKVMVNSVTHATCTQVATTPMYAHIVVAFHLVSHDHCGF